MSKAVSALGGSGGAAGQRGCPQPWPRMDLGWGHDGFAACNVPASKGPASWRARGASLSFGMPRSSRMSGAGEILQ